MAYDSSPVVPAEVTAPLSPNQQIVMRAIEIISDPDRWTVGRNAEDIHERWVHWSSNEAVRFCARGAIYRAANELGYSRVRASYIMWSFKSHGRSLVKINDNQGQLSALSRMRRYAR